MAYNFLELVNAVNRRLNEVELTQAQFSSAKGFYAQVKDSVNAALRDINHTHYEWPFNHDSVTETLTVGDVRYSFPADTASIDFDSFRIKANDTFGTKTQRLSQITYDTYLQRYVDQEYSSDTSLRNIPQYVAKSPSDEYVLAPAPNQAYEVVFEYFKAPVDLSSYSDVPTVPERFKHVIIDGAMYHAYMFRSNEQSAQLAKAKFEEGLKRMRTLLINDYEYVNSTYVPNSYPNIAGPRLM